MLESKSKSEAEFGNSLEGLGKADSDRGVSTCLTTLCLGCTRFRKSVVDVPLLGIKQPSAYPENSL
ncbi:hypothetical protein [Phormidium sp. CCY1219]|uniref:hypothetical protein n=1 Tax=Phormidium sp. CCY1219 TaxID=2886104 RepID=UPI002D1EFAB3|nr:hypothetical protein [Phormidium sp. CCY1219]MEB3827847.1 hypothetical protein [Phormidium sp. CCY1219]